MSSLKPIFSNTRILFGLLPGLGAMIVIRMAIHLYRPDIEDADHRVRDHPFERLYDCYDFIIVGAGSAGAVLANRLSENPEWSVLLLEAGSDENVLSELPVLFPILQTSSIDWQFVTEPSDEYCLSMVDRRCKWPRGKVLGGSSVLNAMLYIRGNKRDYDNWASLGNVGWSYKDVLPYFLKSEDIRIPNYKNDPYHATGGPLTIEYFNYEQPITRKILEAGQQIGYKILDVNGEYQTGFTRSHATVRDGLRCSTAKAFLRPAAKRPNLHVSVHSLVEKVLIDEHKRAYGVKFSKRGHQRIIKATREVILSAGAIQSPQLLMLSGIGDAEHLKELGIHPVSHLPGVGQNLQDHIAMGGHSFLFDNPYKNGTDYCFNIQTVMSIGALIDFAIHKTGQLYSMMEAEAMAFINTKYQDPSEDYPDIQLFIAPTADNMDGGLFGKRANGLSDEAYAELYEDILFDPSFSIVPLLLRPKSRGYLSLQDANPFTPPKIYPNYYKHPDDVKVMIDGARFVQSLTEQPALKELNTRPNPNRNPGCGKYSLMSDEHLECQARHHTLTIYHPVGTCAMGPVSDPGAVVDPRLRVYGIKSLRVVDASIMPIITTGNTNAPTIMIAEKASDMIKEDWSETTEYQQLKCTSNNRSNGKVSEDSASALDEPSKISLVSQIKPDIFNETTVLFPNMIATDIHNIPLVNERYNKKKEQDLVVTRKYNGKNIVAVARVPSKPYSAQKHETRVLAKEQVHQNVNQDQKPTEINPFYEIPPNYAQQNYAYWPSNILQKQYTFPGKNNIFQKKPKLPATLYDLTNKLNKIHQNPFNNIGYNQHYNPLIYENQYSSPGFNLDKNNIFKKKPKQPAIKHDFTNKLNKIHQDLFNNIGYNQNYDPFIYDSVLDGQNYNQQEPAYYETEQIYLPEGEEKCRIWLYYDGNKYDVIL